MIKIKIRIYCWPFRPTVFRLMFLVDGIGYNFIALEMAFVTSKLLIRWHFLFFDSTRPLMCFKSTHTRRKDSLIFPTTILLFGLNRNLSGAVGRWRGQNFNKLPPNWNVIWRCSDTPRQILGMNRLLQLLVFEVGSPGRCSKDDFAEFCPIPILAFSIPMVWSSVGEKSHPGGSAETFLVQQLFDWNRQPVRFHGPKIRPCAFSELTQRN